MRTFRIFISSPGDTVVERRRAASVVSRLNGEFADIARLETVRWETEFYSAHKTYQDQIPPAVDCDVVIGILRWRLGTELPSAFETQPNGEPYPSGTAYELLTAIENRRAGNMLPDVFVFRFTGGAPSIVIGEADEAAKRRDWATLQSFLARWFVTEQGQFIAALNTYSSEDDFEQQVETLLCKWLAGKVQGGEVVPWPAVKGSPFRGLDAFGARHAPVFFGRSADLRRATDLWRETSVKGFRFLLVVGASGAGKSSLMRAGLIPRMTTPGVVPEVDLWRVAVVRPGDSSNGPFAALATALLRTEADLPSEEEGRGAALPEVAEGDSRTPADLSAVLAHADVGAVRVIVNALTRIADRQRGAERHGRAVRCDLLLLVDQAEELFAPSISSETRARFAELLGALAASGRVWLAVTLRADLYEAWLALPALKRLKDAGATYDLAPPGTAELAEIVRAPAEAAALTFDVDPATGERLDEVLLHEADRPDMLPLVQLALSRLWEARETRGSETVLPLSAYQRLGGVRGIIEEAGETAVAGLDMSLLPPLIRKLGELAPKRGDAADTITSRSVPLTEAAPDPASQALVDALVKTRLLTLSDDAGINVRLAHQRVLSDWKRAATIVTDSANFYRIRDELEIQRRRWEIAKRRNDLLITRGKYLMEAQDVIKVYGSEISADIKYYVIVSARRANRSQFVAWSIAFLFAMISVGLGVSIRATTSALKTAQASDNSARARLRSAQINESLLISEESIRENRAGHPKIAAKLALHGLPNRYEKNDDDQRPFVSDTFGALIEAVNDQRERKTFQGDGLEINSASFNKDGSLVITSSTKEARIWNVHTGDIISVLQSNNEEITSSTLSSDSFMALTTSSDGNTRIWDVFSGDLINTIDSNNASVERAYFDSKGKRVVTFSSENLASIWDTKTGKEIASFESESSTISEDKTLLAVSAHGSINIISISDAKIINIVHSGVDEIRLLSFDRHNNFISSVKADIVMDWNIETGDLVSFFQGHSGNIHSATFSRDGRFLLTSSDDCTARIWETASGKLLNTMEAGTHPVYDAEFSDDEKQVITRSIDTRLWSAENGHLLSILEGMGNRSENNNDTLSDHNLLTILGNKATIWYIGNKNVSVKLSEADERINRSFYSSEKDYVFTSSESGLVRGWDVNKEKQVFLDRTSYSNLAISFDNNQNNLSVFSSIGYFRTWDINSNKIVVERKLEGLNFTAAAISEKCHFLFTADDSSIGTLWDVRNFSELAHFIGHKGFINSVLISNDCSRVLTAGMDGTVKVWDVTTGKLISSLKSNNGPIYSVALSAGNDLLVSGSMNGSVNIWNIKDNKQINQLNGHINSVMNVSFSPDGKRIASASRDGTTRIWNLAENKEIAVLHNTVSDDFNPIDFVSNGDRLLVSFSKSGNNLLWIDRSVQDILKYSYDINPNDLSKEQLIEFHLDKNE